jgi:gliding motility-associated-like protein
MNRNFSNKICNVLRKHCFLIVLSCISTFTPIIVNAQCPLVAAACTGTPVSGSGNVTIPAGASYYIPVGQTLSGDVTFGSGTSVLCIEGTWTGKPSGNPTAGATINVYGTVNNTSSWTFNGGGATFNIYPGGSFTIDGWNTNGGNFFFNNCGTMTTINNFTTSSNVTINNYGLFKTKGSLSTNGNLIFHNEPSGSIFVEGPGGLTFSSGTFINDGYICVKVNTNFNGGSLINNACIASTDFGTNASNSFVNNGVVTITGNFFNSGTNTTNNGTLTITGNYWNSGTFITGPGSFITCVDWGNNGNINGPASGCASFRASGNTQNSGTFTAANSSRIDFKDAGNPTPVGTPLAPMDMNNGNVNSITFTGTCTPTVHPACAACCSTPTPAIAGTTTICNGVSTVLTASGGGTYSWNTGETTTSISVSPTTTTTYTVTVTTGSGCSAITTKLVTVNNLPTPGITGTTIICNGLGTVLTATGGGTYVWNTGVSTTSISVSPVVNTTYTVTVTNGSGCTAKTTKVVTVNNVPTATMGSTPAACGGSNGTATVTATGTATLTYLWSPSGQTTATATGLTAGSYNVTVTDGNGCTKNALVSVNNATGPTASFVSQVNVLCNGSATGSATVTGTGGTGTLTYVWSPGGQTTTSITGLTAGTYICTVTDVNGCAQGKSVTITQPVAGLAPSILSQSNVGCTGSATGSATITVTGGTPTYTYSWSPGGQTTTSISGLTTGTYNVTITDANSCTVQQTVAITQPASSLGSNISSQSNVSCTGNATGSATVTGTGGTPTYIYSWSPGGQTTAAVTGLTAGMYTITITDANGCTKQQTVAITQPASGLTSSVNSQSNVGCTGSATGSATVTGIGGTPGYTYVWSPGGQTTAGLTGLTSGIYSVTITDANGCSKAQTVAITQPASALSTIIASSTATCGQSNGSTSVTASGGTPTYTYSWSPSGGTNSTATGLSAGSYNVTTTDANGCTTNSLVSVNNANGPTVGISGTVNNVGCTGSATGSATVTATGGTGTLTYVWTPSGGTTSTATGLTAGTYICTVTDASGCAQGQTVIITQPVSSLGSTISSQSNVDCTGSATGDATVTGTGGTPAYTYNWSPGGNSTATVNGLTAGTYSVTITDNNGCTKVQTVAITQPASNLASTITSQNNVGCKGDASGVATVSGTGGTPLYTYIWAPAGGSASTAVGLTAGTYTVNVTDANGCTAIQSVVITQPAANLTSGITSQKNVSCNGGNNATVTITASGGTPAYTYSWSPNSASTNIISGLTAGVYTCTVTDFKGCTTQQVVSITEATVLSSVVSSQTNPKCNGDSTGIATVSGVGGTPSYTYTWIPNVSSSNTAIGLKANSYTITVSDSLGCTNQTIVTITQPPVFKLSVSSSAIVCAGESVTLSATPIGGTAPFSFSWLPGGPVVSPLVPTTYKVIGTDSSGCVSDIDSIIITPLPAPTAGFDTVSSGRFHEKYTFTDNSTGGSSWYWMFGDGTTSIVQNPFHVYTAGTYTVTQIVTATSGCTDTITKIIVVHPDILIPNVFTPNHDGINDDFWIPNTGFESFELTIYDRWGLKLFVTNSGEIRWDGRTGAGQEVPDGTYYFLLNAILKTELQGKKYEAKGFINLIRSGGK